MKSAALWLIAALLLSLPMAVAATTRYVNVKNADGVTGWLNKKYCKGKNKP